MHTEDCITSSHRGRAGYCCKHLDNYSMSLLRRFMLCVSSTAVVAAIGEMPALGCGTAAPDADDACAHLLRVARRVRMRTPRGWTLNHAPMVDEDLFVQMQEGDFRWSARRRSNRAPRVDDLLAAMEALLALEDAAAFCRTLRGRGYVLEVLLFSPDLPEGGGRGVAGTGAPSTTILATAMGTTRASLLHGRVKRIYKQFFKRGPARAPAWAREHCRGVVIVDASEIFAAAVRMLEKPALPRRRAEEHLSPPRRSSCSRWLVRDQQLVSIISALQGHFGGEETERRRPRRGM
ncbi:hypothetical protein WA556_002816 [Blastocystis sp. ATCC 50177/Nand II]